MEEEDDVGEVLSRTKSWASSQAFHIEHIELLNRDASADSDEEDDAEVADDNEARACVETCVQACTQKYAWASVQVASVAGGVRPNTHGPRCSLQGADPQQDGVNMCRHVYGHLYGVRVDLSVCRRVYGHVCGRVCRCVDGHADV